MKRITIEEEYLKNPNDLKEDDVKQLQDWIKSQPHLPKIEGDL